MSKELDLNVLDEELPSEGQVQKSINAKEGGCISYNNQLLTEKQLPNTSLRRWLMRETWWILAAFLFVVASCCMWSLPVGSLFAYWTPGSLLGFWSHGPTIGLLIALGVGTTPKSRGVFILVCTVLSSTLVVILAAYFREPEGVNGVKNIL
jgi:FtsH-binding integral membrane protein